MGMRDGVKSRRKVREHRRRRWREAPAGKQGRRPNLGVIILVNVIFHFSFL